MTTDIQQRINRAKKVISDTVMKEVTELQADLGLTPNYVTVALLFDHVIGSSVTELKDVAVNLEFSL